ncbi:MAG: hypothetical protein HND49_10275 [Planctomycetes bacterium]|nr:hypothetical protein [Planctomycetota bacterium]
MVLTEMEMKVLQLSVVRRAINTKSFESFEKFVELDRYRQDLEIEVDALERYGSGVMLRG